MDDFERSLKSLPYPKLLDDTEFIKALKREYADVTAIDYTLSLGKFLEKNLTSDEIKAFESGDYFVERKVNDLERQFYKMLSLHEIPNDFKVKDIKQTSIYRALSAIQKLLQSYQDLAMQNVDSSQKAAEYFVNLKDNLIMLNNSAQLALIDEIMTESFNMAIFCQEKFHSMENATECKKRWEQLKNSLNASLVNYKNNINELYSNPPSLHIKIDAKNLIELFDTWKSNKFGVIDNETEFYYFSYAFRGEPIPPDKQPYRPIRVTTSKSKFQRFLREVLPIEQITIPADIKRKIACLFVDKNGKPLRLYNE